MSYIPYNKKLKENSRELRNHSTKGEIILWKRLRARKFRGYAFNRQKPLGNYIADFYCKKLNLVIEIDGCSHTLPGAEWNDRQREIVLQDMGLDVLRFTEAEICFRLPYALNMLDSIITEIENRSA